MRLAAGARLGAYEIQGSLGAGGMGEVYRARDTRLNRSVALKILPGAFALDPDRLSRFRREAQLLASLNHPYIAAIYGVEESDEGGALILEFVDGPTLADRLVKGPIRLDEALRIARQIADALGAAHEQGIIHRDLKPANIKLRPDGTVKVLDFGLAKALEPASSSSMSGSPTVTAAAMTEAGAILGTAAYMSPEQARGERIDQRSDVWSFGCVLYEMLTGRRAFGGNTLAETIAGVLERSVDFARLPAATPGSIRRVLRRCLEKDTKQRMHHFADVRLDLDEPAAPNVGPETFGHPRAFVVWIVAALALAAAGVAWIMWMRAPASAVTLTRFTIQPPAAPIDYPDSWLELAVSPDGRAIVFVGARQHVNGLWLRNVDDETLRPLEGTDDARSPFWSPDGRYIGFSARGKLWKTTRTGGTIQLVTDAGNPMNGTWSAAGDILFERRAAPGVAIYRVSADGGPATAVTRPDRFAMWPSVLPDGRHFIYVEPSPEGNVSYLASVDGATRVPLMSGISRAEYAAPGYLMFVREGTLVAQRFDARSLKVVGDPIAVADEVSQFAPLSTAQFSVSSSGVLLYRAGLLQSRLTWLDRTGLEIETIDPPQPLRHANLSPDGSKAAVEMVDRKTGGIDVWVYDLVRRIPERIVTSAVRTPGGGVQKIVTMNLPIWSPDGRDLAYTLDIEGPPTLFRHSATAGGDIGHQLLPTSTTGIVRFAWSWSPDGRAIVYSEVDPLRHSTVWMLPLGQNATPVRLLDDSSYHDEPTVSPDGRWLAFVSGQSGSPEIHAQAFPLAKGQRQLTSGGARRPRWIRDGSDLVLFYGSGTHLMSLRLGRGEGLRPGRPTPLFRVPPGMIDYDVAADGKRFLAVVPVSGRADLPFAVVQHWTEALTRR